jgi:hypothetical protein
MVSSYTKETKWDIIVKKEKIEVSIADSIGILKNDKNT